MTSQFNTNQQALKLDFNERSDYPNPLLEDFCLDDGLWRYPDRQPLEAALAEINQLKPQQVICTNGGDEAIMILMRLLAEAQSSTSSLSGARLILPLPAFSQYTFGIESWQLDAVQVAPNEDLTIDYQALKNEILSNPHCITLVTRPNNPTGEFISFEQIVELLEAAKKVKGYLWVDEAYIEFAQSTFAKTDTRETETSLVKLLTQYDNLILLRTLSKAYGLAGIRVGYLLANESIIQQFNLRCMPFNLSSPSIQIALKILQSSGRQEMRNYCNEIVNNRKRLCQLLQDWQVPFISSQANFVMLQLSQQRAQAVYSFLAKNGIAIRPFKEVYLENCLRITIPYQLEKIMSALAQCFVPKLICMDMDGVLIDTSCSYDQAIKLCVKELSGQTVDQQKIDQLRSQGGYNNDWVLTKKILDDLGYDLDLSQVTEAFQKIYLGDNNNGLIVDETPLISDKLVKGIQQSKQKHFAIVTGRPRAEAKIGQALLGLESLDLMSLDDVKQGKPDPEGIKQLQKYYSSSSWMCGDNPDDMHAAVASGSLAIGIGVENKQALYAAGADIVVKNINQIEEWLWPSKSSK
ncbi:MAG: aminotransferase class I/II-fold pyridoxal phosphate-dependent enzyme [Enterobacterales bacterium]|nr:aminotransferase class I/II-fold pyridoxal phosphate-dependent enzyme [Enterobacterales bacterium]